VRRGKGRVGQEHYLEGAICDGLLGLHKGKTAIRPNKPPVDGLEAAAAFTAAVCAIVVHVIH